MGWHRRLEINGCSRSPPSSGSRPILPEESKLGLKTHTKDDKRSIFRAISFLGDRDGSSAIRNHDHTTLRSALSYHRATRRRISHLSCLSQLFLRLLLNSRELLHSCIAQWVKTGFHVFTRSAWNSVAMFFFLHIGESISSKHHWSISETYRPRASVSSENFLMIDFKIETAPFRLNELSFVSREFIWSFKRTIVARQSSTTGISVTWHSNNRKEEKEKFHDGWKLHPLYYSPDRNTNEIFRSIEPKPLIVKGGNSWYTPGITPGNVIFHRYSNNRPKITTRSSYKNTRTSRVRQKRKIIEVARNHRRGTKQRVHYATHLKITRSFGKTKNH